MRMNEQHRYSGHSSVAKFRSHLVLTTLYGALGGMVRWKGREKVVVYDDGAGWEGEVGKFTRKGGRANRKEVKGISLKLIFYCN